MNFFKIAVYSICFTSLFILAGCQNNKFKQNPDLLSVELLRGDIILCGGDQFGEVSFALSCDPGTQEIFDLAVSLLHSFEHEEAEKAFVQVLDIDPDCPMAYWGLAMSKIGHPKWGPSANDFEQGTQVLMIASSIPATEREREYLGSVNAYYDQEFAELDHGQRLKKMDREMEKIYTKYPDDDEAAILYAMTLFATADPQDKTYATRKKAGLILESIYPDQPNHPGIAHYIIHNYDSPELAHLALNSARKYARIAPASAHAQHMPSHIFTRLGLWDESIESNINSASSAVCYAHEIEMDGQWGNEIHAMDYLVYAHLQKGDNMKANEQYEHLKTISSVFDSSSPYNYGAIPARIVLENKQWTQAAELTMPVSEYQWDEFPWENSLLHFARSLGSSHTGDFEEAEKELSVLESMHQELTKLEDQYKANQVMIQIKTAQAWILLAKSNNEEALSLMTAAADMEDSTEKHPITPGELLPARELLGDMLLALNQPQKALEAYELNLVAHPNRFNGLYGAAVAAQGAGNLEKAAAYFDMLLILVETSASDRPEVFEARAFFEPELRS